MNTRISRAITVLATCAMLGGPCGCVYMSDQIRDYPLETSDPMTAVVGFAFVATLASTAPAVNSIVDEKRLNKATGKTWYQGKTTRDYLTVALTSKKVDVRRLAVLKILDSGDVASDWAFDGLETVAREDSSSLVRWITIRGLSRVHDPRPVRVALDMLNELKGEPGTNDVRPPDDEVRWACLLLLDDCCVQGLVGKDQQEAVRDVMIRHLSQAYHHDVRFTAAKGLGHFHDKASRAALTKALTDGHVSVEHRAKRSLEARWWTQSFEHVVQRRTSHHTRERRRIVPGAVGRVVHCDRTTVCVATTAAAQAWRPLHEEHVGWKPKQQRTVADLAPSTQMTRNERREGARCPEQFLLCWCSSCAGYLSWPKSLGPSDGPLNVGMRRHVCCTELKLATAWPGVGRVSHTKLQQEQFPRTSRAGSDITLYVGYA